MNNNHRSVYCGKKRFNSFQYFLCATYSMFISTYTKYWPPSKGWRLCQRMYMTIEKVYKTIYMFHELVFDRGYSNLECFNRVTYNYGLSDTASSSQEYEECMWYDCLQGLFCSNSYIFVCYFVHHDKSSNFTPVFKTTPVQMLLHVTNTRCVSLSVGDHHGSLALNNFELINFTFIIGVKDRTRTL